MARYSLSQFQQRYGESAFPLRLSPGSRSLRAQFEIDFGCVDRGEDGVTAVDVEAAWVAAGSRIVCTASATPTADHGAADAAIEGIQYRAVDLMTGIGFTLMAFAPNNTWGKYLVDIRG